MLPWFYALSRKKQIVVTVLGLHGFLLLGLMVEHWIFHIPKRTAIAVKTVRMVAPVAQIAVPTPVVQNKKPEPPKLSVPKKAPPPVAAKPAPPRKIVPAPTPKKQPIAQKAPPPSKQNSLIEEISSSFAALAAPGIKTVAPTTKKPLSIPKLDLSVTPTDALPNTTDEVIAFLQESLKLPEYGEVKAKITIDIRGQLVSVEIVEAKSAKNGQFLKNRLPELQFPCFNETTSLTIVFRNAI